MQEDSPGGEEELEDKQGSREDQQEDGESDGQDEEKDGNLSIDNTDQGSGEEETGEEEGYSEDEPAGPGGIPEDLSEEDAAASEAVDEFDQLGKAAGDDPELQPGEIPAEDGAEGSGVSMIMMEQWLERIEGDPAYLMRNQFMIEEQLEMQRRGRKLMETRPW